MLLSRLISFGGGRLSCNISSGFISESLIDKCYCPGPYYWILLACTIYFLKDVFNRDSLFEWNLVLLIHNNLNCSEAKFQIMNKSLLMSMAKLMGILYLSSHSNWLTWTADIMARFLSMLQLFHKIMNHYAQAWIKFVSSWFQNAFLWSYSVSFTILNIIFAIVAAVPHYEIVWPFAAAFCVFNCIYYWSCTNIILSH